MKTSNKKKHKEYKPSLKTYMKAKADLKKGAEYWANDMSRYDWFTWLTRCSKFDFLRGKDPYNTVLQYEIFNKSLLRRCEKEHKNVEDWLSCITQKRKLCDHKDAYEFMAKVTNRMDLFNKACSFDTHTDKYQNNIDYNKIKKEFIWHCCDNISSLFYYHTEDIIKFLNDPDLLRRQDELRPRHYYFDDDFSSIDLYKEAVAKLGSKYHGYQENHEYCSSKSSNSYNSSTYTYNSFSSIYFTNCNTKSEAKKRYRELVKQYHPDNNPSGASIMREINIEYDKLQQQLEA